MSFHLNGENKKLVCASDNKKGRSAELIHIQFSAGYFPIDEYPLHLELPSNGTVMELNSDMRKVIYYEFEAGEALWLKCVAPTWSGGPVVYLQSGDSVTCGGKGCYISKLLELTREDTTFSCYLKEQNHPEHFSKEDLVLREIRVIFRWKGLIATTSTTTVAPNTPLSTVIPTNQTEVDLDHAPTHVYMIVCILSVLGVMVLIAFLIVCLRAQKRCCYRPKSQAEPLPGPRPDPATAYYENMLSVFIPINQLEAEAMENHYEEIQ